MNHLISLALHLVALAVTLALVATAWRSVRRDPRWLGNGVLIMLAAGAVLLLSTDATPWILVLILVLLSPLLVLVLIGFLIANGVVMLRREGRSLGNLLSLLAGLGLLGVVSLEVFLVFEPNPVVASVALFAVLVTGYLGALFVGYLLYAWFYGALARQTPADFVIALGSGLKDGQRVTPLLAARVDFAIARYREQRALGRPTKLVLSGGKGSDERVAEARAMADHALGRGVPASDLIVEDRSATTEENLRFSGELIRSERARTGGSSALTRPAPRAPLLSPPLHASILIVTSNYHAMRAAALARRVGLPAHAIGAPTARYFWPSAVLREFVAVLAAHRWRHAVAVALLCLPLPALVLAGTA